MLPGRHTVTACTRRQVLAILLLLAGCGAGRGQPALAWSHTPRVSLESRDFRDSFAGDGLIIVARKPVPGHDGELLALDARNGDVRWTVPGATWVARRPGAASPIFVLAEAPSPPPGGSIREAREIDPRTGAVTRVVTFERPVSVGFSGFWAYAGGRLVYRSDGRLGAIDAESGRELWTSSVDASVTLALVLPDLLLVAGTRGYAAYALADGRRVFSLDGYGGEAVAPPGGDPVYVWAAESLTAAIDGHGRAMLTLPGRPVAASSRFVATLDATAAGSTLRVFAHGSGAPHWTRTTAGGTTGFDAVALHEPYLFFFQSGDDGPGDNWVWRVDLDHPRPEPVVRITRRLVIGGDVVGVAPAVLTAPPIYRPPFLYVLDWELKAYRLDR